jgi:hypothetical protein
VPQQATSPRHERSDGHSAIVEAHPAGFRLPCAEQTPQTVALWLADHGTAGAVVVVRHAQWNLYEYHLDEISKLNARLGRVYLAQHGAFDFTGAGTSGPRGYLTLLEPTRVVLDAAMDGKTWLHGRPAFKRPLSALETKLLRVLKTQRSA